MKGYKIFKPDWTCRGKQYTCPGEFREDVKPSVCNRGMHFCANMADCFEYYGQADETYKYAEVEALGEVVTDGNKSCTDHLFIVRELTFEEVKKLTNTGDCNTGDCNTGNWNTGNWNTTTGTRQQEVQDAFVQRSKPSICLTSHLSGRSEIGWRVMREYC